MLSTCARRTEAGRKVETADRSSIVPRRWTLRAMLSSVEYAGGVLKCWRGGRDDLALPSRRARARVSAAGDASLRPWPREQHACMRASGSPPVAPSESTDSADVLGLRMLAPAEGLHGRHRPLRARYSDFAICPCGGISQICQWYRVCDAGALRAEPLATLLSCAVKNPGFSWRISGPV